MHAALRYTGHLFHSFSSHLMLWDFWIKRILMRILVVIAIVFATYNPWRSALAYLGDDFKASFCSTEAFITNHHMPSILVGLLLLAIWTYLLNKCWRGVGSSWFKAALPAAIVFVLLYLLLSHHLIAYGSTLLTVAIELAIGLILGLCFCFTLIDRQLSGVVTTSTVVQHDTEGSHHGLGL
jgi:hypothetical protein